MAPVSLASFCFLKLNAFPAKIDIRIVKIALIKIVTNATIIFSSKMEIVTPVTADVMAAMAKTAIV